MLLADRHMGMFMSLHADIQRYLCSRKAIVEIMTIAEIKEKALTRGAKADGISSVESISDSALRWNLV